MPESAPSANSGGRIARPLVSHHSRKLEPASRPSQKTSATPPLHHRRSSSGSFFPQAGPPNPHSPHFSETAAGTDFHHLDRARLLSDSGSTRQYSRRSKLGQLAAGRTATSSRRISSSPSPQHRSGAHHPRSFRSPQPAESTEDRRESAHCRSLWSWRSRPRDRF